MSWSECCGCVISFYALMVENPLFADENDYMVLHVAMPSLNDEINIISNMSEPS